VAEPASLAIRSRLLLSTIALIRLGPLMVLLLLCIAAAILSPHFLTLRNLQNIGVQSAVVGILALGQLLVIITRGIDVSVGSVLAFSAVVGAIVSPDSGLGFVGASLAAGAMVGAINGGLITVGNLPQPLIVTVATMGVARGIAQILTGGQVIGDAPALAETIGSGFVGGVPISVLILFGATMVLGVLTTMTRFGRWLYAVGGNPEAARKLGVPTAGVIFTGYLICGLMAGLAGLINAGRTDSVTPVAGAGLELYAITAVVVGGASLFGGQGNVWNVLIGALIIAVIRNVLDLVGVEPFYQTVAVGVLILLALLIDTTRGRLESRLRAVHAIEHST
jgi:ribose transport system permease protein